MSLAAPEVPACCDPRSSRYFPVFYPLDDVDKDNSKLRLLFVDASPSHRRADHSILLSPSSTLVTYEHKLSRYLPAAAYKDDTELTVDLAGGKMLLYTRPTRESDDPAIKPRLFLLRV